jgi:DNA-binding NarL/FixJ family response regulator
VIRVAVIDDQALVRMGLATLIGSEPDLELVGEAADGRAGLALLRRTRPDVVLCDIRMPVLDGLGLLAEVAEDADLDPVRVVVLTTFELDEYVFEAMRAGASGFLVKHTEPAELVRAVRVVADGEALLSPSVTRRLVSEFAARTKQPAGPSAALAELTLREREVMALVAEGLTNAEIGERLFMSPATARTHVSRILTKLGARDRTQLVVMAYESGLVRPGWRD